MHNFDELISKLKAILHEKYNTSTTKVENMIRLLEEFEGEKDDEGN